MTIEEIKNKKLLLFECISGSRAYGLDTPESDTDIKGVFILPKNSFYSLNYTPQINNETNDLVYYELKRFIELLTKNNPNILELLFTPAEFVLFKHPLWEIINPGVFISKLCKETFAGYAYSQVKKARGLKKKILNPVSKQKKSIINFIYVINNVKSIPLEKWLKIKNYNQSFCGLVNIPNMKNVYALFYDEDNQYNFSGIIKSIESGNIRLSSIPKDLKPEAILYVNSDGYSRYCKEYNEYWEWVEKRNDTRYKKTLSHGKNYDAKNMMHTFRLLGIAEEIALTHKFSTKRPDREELLKIKSGFYDYDDLIKKAADKIKRVNMLFDKSSLPGSVNLESANSILIEIREKFYSLNSE